MATAPTLASNQVNVGTLTNPVIKTNVNPSQTLTQGQSFNDGHGNTGIVNYDTTTGAKLAPGAKTTAAPTTVVSSNAASQQYNSMATTAASASAAQTSQALVNGQNAGNPTQVNAANSPAGANPNQTNTTTQPTTTTAEDKILNAPEKGMQEAYNVQTGQRSDQPADAPLPAGYSSQNPSTRTDVTNTADTGDGIVIKQFSDGSYGRFNTITGSYTAGTAGEFQQATNVTNTQAALTNLQNGIYTPAQQNQITAIQQGYAALIQQQQQANANATGAVTLAENMYGMGTSISGQGEITQSINAGITKIAALQSKMNSDISNLTEKFNSDDTTAAKNAFDEYSTTQQGIQKALDDMQSQLQAQKSFQLEQQKFAEQQKEDTFNNTMESDKFTYQQKQDAIQNKIAEGGLSVEQQRLALEQKQDLITFNAQYGGLLDPQTGLLKSGQSLNGLGTQTNVPGIGSVTDKGSTAFQALPKGVQSLVVSNSAGGIVIDSSTPQGKQFLADASDLQQINGAGLSDNDSMKGRQLFKNGNILSTPLSKTLKDIPNVDNMTVGQAKAYLQNQMATTAGVPVGAIKYADPAVAQSTIASYMAESPSNASKVNAFRQANPTWTPAQVLMALGQ